MAEQNNKSKATPTPTNDTTHPEFKQKIYAISYTSRMFENRYNTITKEALYSRFFDYFRCFTEKDIPATFKNMIGGTVWNNWRGAGWWTWKPYIIKEQLRQIRYGDILVYYDGGCTINTSTPQAVERYKEYIEMVNDSSHCGMLRFELQFYEKDYTNRHTLEYFHKKMGYSMDMLEDIYKKKQYMATIIIMKKNDFVVKFFDTVLEILKDDPKLFSEYYNKSGETHRHDQSTMSILYRLMGGDLYVPDETYHDGGAFTSEYAKTKPIWASKKK